MAAEGFPVARIEEYAKPCEPAIHVLRSQLSCFTISKLIDHGLYILLVTDWLKFRPPERESFSRTCLRSCMLPTTCILT